MSTTHGIGNAGEFYVLAQLAQRGYIAAKTDDGQTLIDVICTNPDTLQSVNIQVKTTTYKNSSKRWLMSKKNERDHDSLWYVLIELGNADERPDFYIFHSSVVGPAVAEDHSTWISEPKANGEPRKDTSMRQFWPTDDQLAGAKEAWSTLFS